MDRKDSLFQEVGAVVDGSASERVLVIGSLPPLGTDLDLMARPSAEEPLKDALRRAGLLQSGDHFVRLGFGAALEVELVPAAGWGLPEAELESLFEEALPLDGRRRLAEPAPHHHLLILATRLHRRGDRLSDRRRSRIDRAVEQDPAAWEKAAERLSAWGDGTALERLREAHDGRNHPSARMVRRARRMRSLPRRRRATLIALSGVDGSGKSLQTEALSRVLTDLGLTTSVEWIPLAHNPAIERSREGLNRLLAVIRDLKPRKGEEEVQPRSSEKESTTLRRRSRALNYAWVSIVALVNGVAHARRTARNRARGTVTIFDRYVLDSMARLRFFYGEDLELRLPRSLIRALSPRPTASFFLDVSAGTAGGRKDDGWGPDELERQVAMYREEQHRLGVAIHLDGERPAEELAIEIAAIVWNELRADAR